MLATSPNERDCSFAGTALRRLHDAAPSATCTVHPPYYCGGCVFPVCGGRHLRVVPGFSTPTIYKVGDPAPPTSSALVVELFQITLLVSARVQSTNRELHAYGGGCCDLIIKAYIASLLGQRGWRGPASPRDRRRHDASVACGPRHFGGRFLPPPATAPPAATCVRWCGVRHARDGSARDVLGARTAPSLPSRRAEQNKAAPSSLWSGLVFLLSGDPVCRALPPEGSGGRPRTT